MLRSLVTCVLVLGTLSSTEAAVIDAGAIFKLQDANIDVSYESPDFEVLADFLDHDCEPLGEVGNAMWYVCEDAIVIVEYERRGVSLEVRPLDGAGR